MVGLPRETRILAHERCELRNALDAIRGKNARRTPGGHHKRLNRRLLTMGFFYTEDATVGKLPIGDVSHSSGHIHPTDPRIIHLFSTFLRAIWWCL